MISIGTASDYATIYNEKFSAYYGYEICYCLSCKKFNDSSEHTCPHCGNEDLEWSFEFKQGDNKVAVPFSRLLSCDNSLKQFNTQGCLLVGLGRMIETGWLKFVEVKHESKD